MNEASTLTRIKVLHVLAEIGLWLATLLLVLAFGKAGLNKFSDTGGWARAFAHWGYPPWFRVLVGIAEVVAVLALLYPRTASYGALVGAAVMLGGVFTHVRAGTPGAVWHEAVPLALCLLLLTTRWRRRLRPAP
jgi:uncharacterized membrane protein YphA (DoxX/SURF4 family)